MCDYPPFHALEMDARKGPGMSLKGDISLRIKYRKNNIMTTNGIQNTGRFKLFSRMTNSDFGLISPIAVGVLFWSRNLKVILLREMKKESARRRMKWCSWIQIYLPTGWHSGVVKLGTPPVPRHNPASSPTKQWNMAAYLELIIAVTAVTAVVVSCRSSGARVINQICPSVWGSSLHRANREALKVAESFRYSGKVDTRGAFGEITFG
jgi:hypothetical protein